MLPWDKNVSTSSTMLPYSLVDIPDDMMEICYSQDQRWNLEMPEKSQNSDPMSLAQSPNMTNLDQMIHDETNSNCRYPQRSKTVSGLRNIDEIPHKYQHIFSSYPSFNAFQSNVMSDVIYSDKSVVISAPTGSGKTVIFELAIVRLLIKMEELQYNGNFMIIYLAPIKALCSERFRDWSYKFSPLRLTCQEVTGDTDTSDLSQVSQYNILLTTPEKWDSLTRKWRANERIIKLVKLFLIDEVHILNDERRGPVMEAVVSRMKTVQTNCQQGTTNMDFPIPMRFIAVSATIPNVEDIGFWLGDFHEPAISFKLGEDFRPVKLNKIVLGYNCPQSLTPFRFDMMLSYKLKDILLKYAEGKPAMIFCSTRKGVLLTSKAISQQLTFHFNIEQQRRITSCANMIKENKIKALALTGVGCHHAGMDIQDRNIMEDLFRSGNLPVLVTTSTLAMGVNLPAHLVIIKSTQQFANGGYQEYSESQLLQMIGRAGRPQFDTSATAIIMTKNSKKEHYEKLVEGKDWIESSLHQHLIEHLNSEVVLFTITEKTVAINWIRSTFLYVRAMQNPRHYGFPGDLTKSGIENKLNDLCLRDLNALASINLIEMDVLDVRPTESGRLMAQYYMTFETMKIFTKVIGTEKLSEMLVVVSSCHEFSDYQLRVSDKKTLNTLNKPKSGIRFPLKGTFKTREMKINCLIQASFGTLSIQEPSLHQEAMRIIRIGERVSKCLSRFLSLQPHYQSLLSATLLAKCFHCCMWENSWHISRQLERIGPVLSSLLVAAGKTSFQSIARANPRDLERILNRPPPMGNRLQNAAQQLPQYNLELTVNSDNSSASQVEITIALINLEHIQISSTAGPNHWLSLIVGDSNNKLLLYERFKDDILIREGVFYRSLKVSDHLNTIEVYANLISEQWVGLDSFASTKLVINNIFPQHVQSNLQNYIKTSSSNTNGQLDKNKKCTPAVKEIKQKTPSISTQLRSFSSEFLQDLTTKKLQSNAVLTPSHVNLDRYLYTPMRNKKLLSPWKEFGETKSNETFCASGTPRSSAISQFESQILSPSNTHPISINKKLCLPTQKSIQVTTDKVKSAVGDILKWDMSKSQSTPTSTPSTTRNELLELSLCNSKQQITDTNTEITHQVQTIDSPNELFMLEESNEFQHNNFNSLYSSRYIDKDISCIETKSKYMGNSWLRDMNKSETKSSSTSTSNTHKSLSIEGENKEETQSVSIKKIPFSSLHLVEKNCNSINKEAQQSQSMVYQGDFSGFNENQETINDFHNTEFSDNDIQYLETRSNYTTATTKDKRENVCINTIKDADISLQTTGKMSCDYAEVSQTEKFTSCSNSAFKSTKFGESSENMTLDSRKSPKFKHNLPIHYYPVFSKTVDGKYDSLGMSSLTQVRANDNQMQKSGYPNREMDSNASCAENNGDNSKSDNKYKHSIHNTTNKQHESLLVNQFKQGGQHSNLKLKKYIESAPQFSIYDDQRSYVEKTRLKYSFDLGVDQFLSNFLSDEFDDEFHDTNQSKNSKQVQNYHIPREQSLQSTEYSCPRKKKKICEYEQDWSIMSLLYGRSSRPFHGKMSHKQNATNRVKELTETESSINNLQSVPKNFVPVMFDNESNLKGYLPRCAK